MVLLLIIYCGYCYKPNDEILIKDVYKYLTIHSKCYQRFPSCNIHRFCGANNIKINKLLEEKSFFIIIKPKIVDIEKDYLKEIKHISTFHEIFFDEIDITMATIDCTVIKSATLLCVKNENIKFKYILVGKLFGNHFHLHQFNNMFLIEQPLTFIMNTIESHLERLEDWKEITTRMKSIKDLIIIINIRKNNGQDLTELLKLYKLERGTNGMIVANISKIHDERRITVLKGSCVDQNRSNPKICIIHDKNMQMENSFICESVLSLLDLRYQSNILDINNISMINKEYLHKIIYSCPSVFIVHNIIKERSIIIKLFEKYKQIFSNKTTFLILATKKQLRTLSTSEGILFHFKQDNIQKISIFNGSLIDERNIENFFKLQFHIMTNRKIINSDQFDIYNEYYYDDLVRNWKTSTNKDDPSFHIIPSMDLKKKTNSKDYIMELIRSQNITILVLLQKWITSYPILSHLLQHANIQLLDEIGIVNVYKGVDCWIFDKFCINNGIISDYPIFLVYKNGKKIKSFKNGQYSLETFRRIVHLFLEPTIKYISSEDEFHQTTSKLTKISEVIIIKIRYDLDRKLSFLGELIDKYHGIIPILDIECISLPTTIRSQCIDTNLSQVIISYQGSSGWTFMKPRILSSIEDMEIALTVLRIYSVNALNIEDLNHFKFEQKQLLIYLSLNVEIARMRKLREQLPDTIVLKYVNILNNEKLVQILGVSQTPSLVLIDFSNNKVYNKYQKMWGSQYVLEWLVDIMKGNINPSTIIANTTKHSIMKPRIHFENKIRFGQIEEDQSSYYVNINNDPDEYPIKYSDNMDSRQIHDEL